MLIICMPSGMGNDQINSCVATSTDKLAPSTFQKGNQFANHLGRMENMETIQ
jgi:hypothetical protein